MALSMKGTLVPLAIKLSLPGQMLLDVAQYEIGGSLRTLIKDIDRAALSQLSGVEDNGTIVLGRRRQNACSAAMDHSSLSMPPILSRQPPPTRTGGSDAMAGVRDILALAAPRITIESV